MSRARLDNLFFERRESTDAVEGLNSVPDLGSNSAITFLYAARSQKYETAKETALRCVEPGYVGTMEILIAPST